MPDRIWESLSDTRKTKRKNMLNEIRSYLLEQYHCNLTMFVEEILQNCDYENEEFWDTLVENDIDPKDFIDDAFADSYQEHRQRTISSGVMGAY